MPASDVRQAAGRLGAVLRELGYSEDAIGELGSDAISAGPEDVPVLARRLPATRLGTAIEALFLALPVAKREAVRALGRRGVDALEATGLADVRGDVSPRARIVPVGDLLIAGDTFSKGRDDPPDYVAPFSPTSFLCAALTPRKRVASALDVGTGSGAQALHAARHARRVIATDVNEHALELTRINAALNGMTNIECRLGSLFEPVVDEQFDLITCNAPYVVSPERRWLYRDSGHVGDAVSRAVVEGAAAHLVDGGFATLNVSWLGESEDLPDERLLEWIDTSTCDAWVLVAWEADALDHAAGWTEDDAGDANRREEALDEWTRYLEQLGADWVSEGTVVLHRRSGRRRLIRIDTIDPDEVEDSGEQVERAFASRRRLSELPRNDGLLDQELSLVTRLRLERELDPRRRHANVTLTLGEGTHLTVETTNGACEVVARLDAARTLRRSVDEVARDIPGEDAAKLRREALRLSRELLELGALTITS